MTVSGQTHVLSGLLWDPSRVGGAVPELLRHAGWRRGAAPIDVPVPRDGRELKPWLDACAASCHAELESTELRYDRLPAALIQRAPLILRLGGSCERYLCVVTSTRRTSRVLKPDGGVRTVPTSALIQALRDEIEAPMLEGADRLTAQVRLTARRRHRLRAAYLRQALGNHVAADGWVIKPGPGASFWRQLRYAKAPSAAAGFFGAQMLEYGLWIASWWLLGRALLLGHLTPPILTGWTLMLATLLVARLASERFQSELAVGIGALVKARLLDGVLHLDSDTTRGQGVGHLLGRTIDAESVEALALSGGFATFAGGLQLAVALVILVGIETGPELALELVAWCGFMAWAMGHLWRQRSRWVDVRLELTHELVESMVGYRTRLAQQAPERWHEGEDEALAGYLRRSGAMDRTTALMLSAPRAWLAASVLTLVMTAPPVATSPIALAGAIGAILLAYGAQRQLSTGALSIIDAAIAWQRVRVLFDASRHAVTSRPKPAAPNVPVPADERADGSTPVLVADALSYRHARHRSDTLTACTLTVRRGERILLEGPSGAGKSTLAAILAGLRSPGSGTLVASGRRLVPGDGRWREAVVIAPQFHDNHVVADTFLFNLVMGRRWPATDDDISEAMDVCRELGLGPLIERMPGGMHQPIGDSGWQLSHGERSRLFVARALLQRANVIIFDESFAALDPETLRTCLACVWNRAPSVILVAHP